MHQIEGKRLWLKIVILFALVLIGIITILTWQEHRIPSKSKQFYLPSKANVERGRYLSILGNCSYCHTSQPQQPFAGGVGYETPVGLIYGSNITPSADFGIGRWTEEDFFNAITQGIAPPERNLYPSMPYDYFRHLTRADSNALYAYLMTLPEINSAPPKNKIPFPYNQRLLIKLWNFFFLKNEALPVLSQGGSKSWERGEYLVNTVSYCGMCHSPAGRFGQLDRDRYLQGGEFDGLIAPNITPEGLVKNGWDLDTLEHYLQTGIAPQKVAKGAMAKIINESTSKMKPHDIHAIATFLLGEEIISKEPLDYEKIATKRLEFIKMHPHDHLLPEDNSR